MTGSPPPKSFLYLIHGEKIVRTKVMLHSLLKCPQIGGDVATNLHLTNFGKCHNPFFSIESEMLPQKRLRCKR